MLYNITVPELFQSERKFHFFRYKDIPPGQARLALWRAVPGLTSIIRELLFFQFSRDGEDGLDQIHGQVEKHKDQVAEKG